MSDMCNGAAGTLNAPHSVASKQTNKQRERDLGVAGGRGGGL